MGISNECTLSVGFYISDLWWCSEADLVLCLIIIKGGLNALLIRQGDLDSSVDSKHNTVGPAASQIRHLLNLLPRDSKVKVSS